MHSLLYRPVGSLGSTSVETRADGASAYSGPGTPGTSGTSVTPSISAAGSERTRQTLSMRPVAFGLLAGFGLLVFYLGTITLAQDWQHALQQLAEDAWFVGAITVGFGTQVGLFTYLRGLHARAAAKGLVASTGTSSAAMLACCAHHLAEVLPVVGLSGAAVFLNAWKTPLLWLGIVMNLGGIAYLLWQIRKQRKQHQMACHA